MITIQNGKLHSDDHYDYRVTSLQRINKNNFVVTEKNTSNVRLLTADYAGNSAYQDKVIWRDTTHNIVKILASYNNLYVLSNSGTEYFFRCFSLKQNLELVAKGLMSNVEVSDPTFIHEFLGATTINENILVANEHKFVKIYDDENASTDPSLQNYFSFLPPPTKQESDRCMPASMIRNCPKHRRLLMQFNYPVSCRPKQALILPSIGANAITLNSQTERETTTWLSNKTTISDLEGDAKLFQFLPGKDMLLNEFDLAGVIKR